jgi:septal ring factor EnvC (AmiA/AmiB activator)
VISPSLAAGLRDVIARKSELARISDEISTRQGEVERIGADQERVRENMKSLKGSAEEKQLVQRYVKQLDEQETRLEALHKEMASLGADQAKAQADLDKAIEGLGAN